MVLKNGLNALRLNGDYVEKLISFEKKPCFSSFRPETFQIILVLRVFSPFPTGIVSRELIVFILWY